MIDIKEDRQLIMENVLSFRGKVTQQEMQEELERIALQMQNLQINRMGPLVTTTFSVEENQEIMDEEIMVSISKEISLERYKFKKIFKLVNALYLQYIGSPNKEKIEYMQNQLYTYIADRNLTYITPIYCVHSDKQMIEGELIVTIDFYIGLSPNIL